MLYVRITEKELLTNYHNTKNHVSLTNPPMDNVGHRWKTASKENEKCDQQ